MSEAEKDRLIKLLIEVFDEASESEGIYFTDNDSAIEILQFIKKFYPSEENIKERDRLIEYLKRGDKEH